ncbi:hypothetical protein C5B86_19445, partial [Haloferax sp. Atlit-19N]
MVEHCTERLAAFLCLLSNSPHVERSDDFLVWIGLDHRLVGRVWLWFRRNNLLPTLVLFTDHLMEFVVQLG